MPVDLLTAASINGAITAGRGRSSLELFGRLEVPEEVREHQRSLRRGYDAVLVGPGTVRVDDPTLTSHATPGHAPVRVTLDPRASIPPGSRFFDGSARTVVGVSAATAPEYRELLASRGVEAVESGDGDRVDLGSFLEALAARGIARVLCEGGGGLNRALLEAGLVRRVHLLVIPAVMDSSAVNLFDGFGGLARLRLEGLERLGDYAVLTYSFNRTGP